MGVGDLLSRVDFILRSVAQVTGQIVQRVCARKAADLLKADWMVSYRRVVDDHDYSWQVSESISASPLNQTLNRISGAHTDLVLRPTI
jgi:hypothetical protein